MYNIFIKYEDERSDKIWGMLRTIRRQTSYDRGSSNLYLFFLISKYAMKSINIDIQLLCCTITFIFRTADYNAEQ